jgi:O-antigen/teichoic acid export membrane protein
MTNDLNGRGKPELNIYVSFVSLVLNVVLNIIWIPRYGIIGAAYATSISYTFAFVAITAIYSRISGNPISKILFIQKSDIPIYKNFILSVVSSLVSKRKKNEGDA